MNREAMQHLGELCRMRLSDEEAEGLAKDFKKVLSYVEQLREVDTEGVETYTNGQTNLMRDDEVDATLDRDEFLKNSPSHIGGMIRVPPVMHA